MKFDAIRNFQDFFISNDVLELPKDETLEIDDLSALWDIPESGGEVPKPDYPVSEGLIILFNRMLAPLGKVLEFDSGKMSGSYGERLSLTFPDGIKMTASKVEKIWARASELFGLMVRTERPTLTLGAGQRLYLLGVDREALPKDPREAFSKLFFDTPAPGFEAKMKTTDVEYVFKEVDYGGERQQAVSLEVKGAATFSIESKLSDYTFEAKSFVHRLLACPRLHIPKGKTLRIEGEQVVRDFVFAKRLGKDPFAFALGQLFAPMRKVFTCSAEAEFDGKGIALFAEEGFTFAVSEKRALEELWVDLKPLSETLLQENRKGVKLPAGVPLIFYNLNDDALRIIDHWEDPIQGIADFLHTQMPPGLEWTIRIKSGTLNIGIDQNLRALKLSIETPMMLALAYPDKAAFFALSLVQNAHPKLAEELKELEPRAMQHLLFKSIYHLCCGHFRYYNAAGREPNYFKEETKERVNSLFEDETFDQAFKAILRNDKLDRRMREIEAMAPEEFDALNLEEEPKEISYVIKEVKTIVGAEQQGSPYEQAAYQELIALL